MLGETIGNFRLTAELGHGGMGTVYLGEHVDLGTKVAIKLLAVAISKEEKHIKRFFNEARAASAIEHTGITKISDAGRHDGRAYLVMEYLRGESLAARLKRGPLGLIAMTELGRQIANVLAATHGAEITHRDLKPDNVFVVADKEMPDGERVKLLDFGIAKLSGDLAADAPTTTTAMGTPDYMAPEQWNDIANIGPPADVYALGCVLFEMAAGRRPFVSESMPEAYANAVVNAPPPLKDLAPMAPAGLAALVAAMLDKAAAKRPRIGEVEKALAGLTKELRAMAVAKTMGDVEVSPPPPPPPRERVEIAPTIVPPPVPAAETPVAPTPSPEPVETRSRTGMAMLFTAGILAAGGAASLAIIHFQGKKGPKCEDVAARINQNGRGHDYAGLVPSFAGEVEGLCTADDWSRELRECIVASNLHDLFGGCSPDYVDRDKTLGVWTGAVWRAYGNRVRAARTRALDVGRLVDEAHIDTSTVGRAVRAKELAAGAVFSVDRPSFEVARDEGRLDDVEPSLASLLDRAKEIEDQVPALERWATQLKYVQLATAADLAAYSPPGPGPLKLHLVTSVGTIECTLTPATAPIAAAEVVGLATGKKSWLGEFGDVMTTPYYDDTYFVRVLPGVLAEGAGHAKGPGYALPNEPEGPSTVGWLLVDRSANLLVSTDENGIDGQVSAIARCDPSVAVMLKLTNAPVDKDGAPNEPLHLTSVTVTR